MGAAPPPAGHLSPDGMFRWDGYQWVPNYPYPGPPPPTRSSNALIFWLAIAAVVSLLVIVFAATLTVFFVSHRLVAATYQPDVIYTRWVPDANAGGGPEPGFKPELTGLTGADISQAQANPDSTGTGWVVDVTFTPHGSQLFSALTRDNVAACPGDPDTLASANCAQRHLTIWLDLSQADIGNWEDGAYVDKVSEPYDLQCLARRSPQVVCPKFVIDPITTEEVDAGEAEISGDFDEQSAKRLARAMNSRAP